MASYYVIFGAAVRPDGTPSGTLRRRVEGAAKAAAGAPDARFLCTGGLSSGGHVEADVMAALLRGLGVDPAAILLEREGRDTLHQVRLCDAILRRAGDAEEVIPCTSRYHIPRCAALLRMLGWRVRTVAMPSDRGLLPWRKLCWYYLKELLALPYDVALLALGRPAGA